LANIASKNGHAVDIFGCSLDQVGLLEMRTLIQKTGGISVLADSFEVDMFTASFRKLFEKNEHGNLKMSFNAILEVLVLIPFQIHIRI
jgi:protein transport protein SEC23